jgi:uncharacterized membrane protein YbhN (UPF0104 family)
MQAAAETAPPPERRFRLRRVLIWLAVIVALGLLAYLLGWNVRAWFSDLWDTLTAISPAYLVAAAILQTAQTILTAVAWYQILRFAYPGRVGRREVLACYATSVALNGFLPANLGTLVMLLMYVAVIAGATFAGVFAGYLVEKIFFTVIGAVVYLYLFLSVGGSFDIKFKWVHEYPVAVIAGLAGAVVVVVIVVRLLRTKLHSLWKNAKEGGQILARPRDYFLRAFLPSFGSWCAKLGVIAVFLAAYSIPVSFHTIMRIVGGNSVANVASVTPGGVGVNQAFNVASLKGVTDSTTATAYSVGQQLFTTAWNILFAAALLIWVFGFTGGKKLVEDSYVGAKEKAAQEAAKRKAHKAEKAADKAAAKAAREADRPA